MDQERWTAAEVSILEEHWQAGLSAGVIGRLMKRSRNSVRGKLDRLGWIESKRENHPENLGGAARKVTLIPGVGTKPCP